MADVFLVVMACCISNDKLAGGGDVENVRMAFSNHTKQAVMGFGNERGSE